MKQEDTRNATDPLTGEAFIKKRSNQVFANRVNQIRYNNLKAHAKRKAKSKMDKILDNNRKVLMKVLGSNKEKIKSRDFLDGAGLHFGYNTHTTMIEGNKWICIYDYGYSLVDKNTFKIKKIKS